MTVKHFAEEGYEVIVRIFASLKSALRERERQKVMNTPNCHILINKDDLENQRDEIFENLATLEQAQAHLKIQKWRYNNLNFATAVPDLAINCFERTHEG